MIEEQIYSILKEEKAITAADLSKKLKKPKNYVLGVLEGVNKFILKESYITLPRLGSERCIVCGENNEFGKSIYMKIPPEFFKNIKYIFGGDWLEKGVMGHENCYKTIGVFLRYPKLNISCYDCNSFKGGWVDGDEVIEECHKWNHSETGHKGVIASNPVCNFFSPDWDLKNNIKFKKQMAIWKNTNFLINQKTNKGFENLMSLLEKAKLIELPKN